jgi:hypothetical protein
LLKRIELALEWSAQLEAIGIDWTPRIYGPAARRWMGECPAQSVRNREAVFSAPGDNVGRNREIFKETDLSGSHRTQKGRDTRAFAAISRL